MYETVNLKKKQNHKVLTFRSIDIDINKKKTKDIESSHELNDPTSS